MTRFDLEGTMIRVFDNRKKPLSKWVLFAKLYCTSEPVQEVTDATRMVCKTMMSCPPMALDTALNQTGVRVSPDLVQSVLKSFENAGMLSFRFFEWAEKQRNYTHNVKAYHSMIESLAKIRQYQIMWDLVNAMRKKGMLNIETFCIIMRKYARAQKVDEAIYTFNVMEKYDISPNLAAFNGLLSALCKSKNVRKAQEIFDSMKDRFVPDSKTYSILLDGWGRAPSLPKAREVFREMVCMGCDPDIVTYGIMVDILCKAGRVDEAVEVVKEMDANNCGATPFIYSVLVHTYGVENRIEDAINTFIEMESKGIKPDVVVYNALIGAFCKANKFKNVHRVLQEMESNGVDPNSRTCNVIISGLISQGETDRAFRVFRRMHNPTPPSLSLSQTAGSLPAYPQTPSEVTSAAQSTSVHRHRTLAAVAAPLAGSSESCARVSLLSSVCGRLPASRRASAGECSRPRAVFTSSCSVSSSSAITATNPTPRLLASRLCPPSLLASAARFSPRLPPPVSARAVRGCCFSSSVGVAACTALLVCLHCLILPLQQQSTGNNQIKYTIFGAGVVSCMSCHGHIVRHGQHLLKLVESCSITCTLDATKCLHALSITMGPIPNQSIFVHNNVISRYLSLGEFLHARRVFDILPQRTVVSYNMLIHAYSRRGDVSDAWSLLCHMRGSDFSPTQYTLSGLLSCELLSICQGMQLQALSIKSGLFDADAFVGTALLGLFGRHGCLDEAFIAFEDMVHKSLVTWNIMLLILARNGFVGDCQNLFRDLVRTGVALSEGSFVAVLSGLVDPEQDLEYSAMIHGLMTKCGFDGDIALVNCLINVYVKCKAMFSAQRLFQEVPAENVVSWNTIIDALVKSGRSQVALEMFVNMSRRGLVPSQATFVAVIDSCASLKNFVCGESIHAKTSWLNVEKLKKLRKSSLACLFHQMRIFGVASLKAPRGKQKNLIVFWKQCTEDVPQCGFPSTDSYGEQWIKNGTALSENACKRIK
ncbi:hypothetical protein AHAS_Ahas03G0142500 [Arachis hypogaea]